MKDQESKWEYDFSESDTSTTSETQELQYCNLLARERSASCDSSCAPVPPPLKIRGTVTPYTLDGPGPTEEEMRKVESTKFKIDAMQWGNRYFLAIRPIQKQSIIVLKGKAAEVQMNSVAKPRFRVSIFRRCGKVVKTLHRLPKAEWAGISGSYTLQDLYREDPLPNKPCGERKNSVEKVDCYGYPRKLLISWGKCPRGIRGESGEEEEGNERIDQSLRLLDGQMDGPMDEGLEYVED